VLPRLLSAASFTIGRAFETCQAISRPPRVTKRTSTAAKPAQARLGRPRWISAASGLNQALVPLAVSARCGSIFFMSAGLGMKPTMRSTICPSLNRIMVGMPVTPN
jgi:hypothetical protein